MKVALLLFLLVWVLMADGKQIATFPSQEDCEAAKARMIYQYKLGGQLECVFKPDS